MASGKKTGGRRAGTPNKATADVKAAASKYSEEALGLLIDIARSSDSDAARVSAIKELLDRAHGKATQAISGPDGGAIPVNIKVTFVTPGGT